MDEDWMLELLVATQELDPHDVALSLSEPAVAVQTAAHAVAETVQTAAPGVAEPITEETMNAMR